MDVYMYEVFQLLLLWDIASFCLCLVTSFTLTPSRWVQKSTKR